jgi:hypothetical protein
MGDPLRGRPPEVKPEMERVLLTIVIGKCRDPLKSFARRDCDDR